MSSFHALSRKDASPKQAHLLINQGLSKLKKPNNQDLANITVFLISRAHPNPVAFSSQVPKDSLI